MSEEKQIRTGGIESKLDGIGTFYLVISITALIFFIYQSQDNSIQKMGHSGLWIGLGIGALAQGIVFRILFQASAEAIRLLKKLNGLPYGGVISIATGEGLDFTCPECGTSVAPEAKFCTQCGIEFDE